MIYSQPLYFHDCLSMTCSLFVTSSWLITVVIITQELNLQSDATCETRCDKELHEKKMGTHLGAQHLTLAS